MSRNSIASSAGAQRKRVGRKQPKNGFGSLKRDIEEGFRYFKDQRPVVAPLIGRPRKSELGKEEE